MAWIKRNLLFVISVVAGLAVTGYCGYLLYSALGQASAASEEYRQKSKNLADLEKKETQPTDANIAAAHADQIRVRQFLADFRKAFADFPTPPKLDPHGFKDFLQHTISRFGQEATNAGVGLTPNYTFGFRSQVETSLNPVESIDPWMQQLEEIGTILRILYQAKINFLIRIQRSSVSQDDNNGEDIIPIVGGTNQWGVVAPYKVDFRAFSTEIAAVLAGFARSSNCFVVKTISVAPSHVPIETLVPPPPAEAPAAAPAQNYIYRPPAPVQPSPFGPGGFERGGREFRDRRMMPRPTPAPQQMQVPVAPAAPAGPEKVLWEQPLFVTIFVDVVKPKPVEQPKAQEPPKRAGRPRQAEH
jgi:hypothetical protein